MPNDCAHARHVRTRSADSTRPQRRARVLDHRLISGRMRGDWFGLPQRRVGHEGLEIALQVLTPRSTAHTLPQTHHGRLSRRTVAQLLHW
jgi:hypothetical protein